MYCPKCGQPTVNLNGRDICTKCGIVFNDDSPHEQVLNQIRSKMDMFKQKNSGVNSKEEYISPVAVSQKEVAPTSSPLETAPDIANKKNVFEDTKTLEDIQKDIRNGKNIRGQIHTGDMAKSKEAVRETEKAVLAQDEPTVHEFTDSSETILNSDTKNIPREEGYENEPEDISSQPVINKAILSSQGGQTAEKGRGYEVASAMIYPSHQINPFLIKIFITVFSILIFFVIVYILYVNLDSVKGVVDNITRLIGEKVFT